MTDAIDEETFQQLRDTIERFVNERLIPNENRVEEEDEIPDEIVRACLRFADARAAENPA